MKKYIKKHYDSRCFKCTDRRVFFLYNAVCDGDCRKWEKRQDKRDVSDGDNFGSWAGIDLFILHVCKK